jgi:hypothetical protein
MCLYFKITDYKIPLYQFITKIFTLFGSLKESLCDYAELLVEIILRPFRIIMLILLG